MALKLSHLRLPALSLLALCCSPLAQAGGLMLYEIGSDNTGLVNAGAAARAQGPSTIASNPAGLSYLAGTQISAGAQVLYGDISFDPDSSTSTSGNDGGNLLGVLPAASFFVSHQVDEQWSLGFGSYGDFGLAENYDNDWAGRYFVQNATIGGLSLVPSTAYKFNDEWSVGLGLKAMYGILQAEAAIDRSPLNKLDRDDGQFKYQDSTWGYGANLGVIYAPQVGTRLGLAYTSKVDLDFEDRLDVKGTGPLLDRLNGLNTQLNMSVPQTATLSLYQQLDAQWALLASANWQDWSQFGEVAIDVDTNVAGSLSTTVDAGFKDTYQLALGTQFQATPKLRWDAGVAYDTSAVSDSNRTVTVPMGETWRVGTGATYALDATTDLNLSWDMAWMGDLPVTQSKSLSGETISGQYDAAWIQTITGNATWRF
jgi:long-chain fatty acid transport protein